MSKPALARRTITCLAVTSMLAAAPAAFAQDYPSDPIRMIVSFAPGGLVDVIARSMLPNLTESLGQPVIIDNRPGAGGTLAEATLARATPDGYTIMMTADSLPANRHLVPNLRYDSFTDLTAVRQIVRIPLVLIVNPDVPANDVKEFLDYARANEGTVSYASPGTGTSNHLYFEVFKEQNDVDIEHVAYRGGGPAMADVIAGHVPVALLSTTLAAPQVASGKVRALAITSEERSPLMPDVPTFSEAGFPDFQAQQWTGLFVPAGTPEPIVQRLGTEFERALSAPEVVARLREMGAEPVMGTQADFVEVLRRDDEVLGKLIRERNIGGQ